MLTIPQDALVQTGSGNTVLLVEGNGYFQSVEVTAGRTLGESGGNHQWTARRR
ncbi:MAG: hypothetical protein ACR5LG_10780 [Sodalis sp. (in: enterobacteria)]|uniref:hypothetical protein n=1 Tax=Sodalis sp. (in: enterobacteria) TaxID=1898979 RepID=UPI003F3D368D